MIKSLNLRSTFDPGGTETLLLNLYNYSQDQIKFYFVLLKDGKYIERLNSETNVHFIKFRKNKIDIRPLFFILRIIRNENIRILHTHQPIELVYAVLIKLFYPHIKIFHTIHLYNPHNDWKFKLEKFLSSFTVRNIVVSNSLKNKLKERNFNVNKIAVLHNAVQITEGSLPIELASKFEKKINYSKADKVIGMIGNFVPEKDQYTVVKAYVEKLILKEPNLKLVFIGRTTSNTEKCLELIPDDLLNTKVFFTGPIESASQYLPYFDLLIMSSKSETFGIVIIEALLKKVPVIASYIDTFQELSYGGKYFNLFKTGDSDDLAERVLNQLNNKDINSPKFLSLSCQYARERYSYKQYISKLEEIYRR